MSVLTLERYPVHPSHCGRFDEMVGSLLDRMRAAAGVLWAHAAAPADGEPSYLLIGEWRTDADADAWEGSEDASAFAAGVDPFLTGDVTRRRFQDIP